MNYGALGSIPRQTKINGQPHMLAYINPEEEGMIQDYRGNLPPVVGPDGVPAYFFGFGGGGGGFFGGGGSSSNDSSSGGSSSSSSGGGLGGFFGGIADAIGGIFGGVADAVSGIFGGGIDDDGTVTSPPVDSPVVTAVKEITKAPVEISEDRLDDKWGYTDPATGNYVSGFIDSINGGGKNTAGAGFAASGGVEADTNNDGFVSASEAEDVGGLKGNFFSGVSNAVGATPLGSGLEATGLAKGAQYLSIPGLLYTGAKYATDNFGTGDARTGVERPDLDSYIAGSESDISPDTTPSFTEGGESMPYSRDIYASQDVMGDFYGGRTGGMWDRFAGSYLTRYGYNPAQDKEMIRKVENPDGTTSFYNLDGQLLDPEQIGDSYDVFDDPTQIKIGEEQVVVGQDNYDARGNLISTDRLPGTPGYVTPLPTPDPYPIY
tara:strand:- start:1693 stop:2994 length:1302 start_codon:yes stop_codon:yes gene_type:complete